MSDSGWSDERVLLLKQLWAEGLSSGAIERRFNYVFSRSAIIGKVHRLGLSARHRSSGPICRPKTGWGGTRPAKFPKAARRTDGLTDIPPTPADPVPHDRVKLLDLKDAHCRWPIGDTRDAEFGFCGRQHAEGSPYCPHHTHIAYVPAQPKKGAPRPHFKAA